MDSVSCVDVESASAAVKIEPKRQLGEKQARKPSPRRDTPTLIICLHRAPGLNKLAGVGSSKDWLADLLYSFSVTKPFGVGWMLQHNFLSATGLEITRNVHFVLNRTALLHSHEANLHTDLQSSIGQICGGIATEGSVLDVLRQIWGP